MDLSIGVKDSGRLFSRLTKKSSSIAYFGDEQVKGVADMPNLKRGGVASIGSVDLDHVVRHLMDKDEKRNLGQVNVGHDSTSKCPMHLGP